MLRCFTIHAYNDPHRQTIYLCLPEAWFLTTTQRRLRERDVARISQGCSF